MGHGFRHPHAVHPLDLGRTRQPHDLQASSLRVPVTLGDRPAHVQDSSSSTQP